jgi:hypothetical protein
MSEDKIVRVSDYLSIQLGLCRNYSQEQSKNCQSQVDKMFWSGMIAICETLKPIVAVQNINLELESKKGINLAAVVQKNLQEEKPTKTGPQKVLKPHCPKCFQSNMDELGIDGAGVKSYACRPCKIIVKILPVEDL